jgi:16S rRNA (adenine1518-N6/adenine1519-N6)-dimethyltransferase
MAWVRRELNALGIPPLKRFGQHFLIDRTVGERLIELAEPTADDIIVEVGPGLGFLTSMLASKGGRVLAVEKDRTLAAYLKDKFSKLPNVTVMEGDALSIQIPQGAKIISSPPYNISSKLILLIINSEFRTAALLLQEEFVKRLTASSGSREYGRISVMLQCKAQAEFHLSVPRDSFYPEPRVNSALVTIRPIKEQFHINNQELFVDMVRTLFTQRRRKLRGVLTRYLEARYPSQINSLHTESSLAEKRIYELNPTELVNLSNQIADAVSQSERV